MVVNILAIKYIINKINTQNKWHSTDNINKIIWTRWRFGFQHIYYDDVTGSSTHIILVYGIIQTNRVYCGHILRKVLKIIFDRFVVATATGFTVGIFAESLKKILLPFCGDCDGVYCCHIFANEIFVHSVVDCYGPYCAFVVETAVVHCGDICS